MRVLPRPFFYGGHPAFTKCTFHATTRWRQSPRILTLKIGTQLHLAPIWRVPAAPMPETGARGTGEVR